MRWSGRLRGSGCKLRKFFFKGGSGISSKSVITCERNTQEPNWLLRMLVFLTETSPLPAPLCHGAVQHRPVVYVPARPEGFVPSWRTHLPPVLSSGA